MGQDFSVHSDPMPTKSGHRGPLPEGHPRRKYNFPELEIGQGFYIDSQEASNKICRAARALYKRRGHNISVRALGDGKIGVWRKP